MAIAEWLAHWLHMREVQGSNPGLGMLSFSCQMLKNLTKIGFVACQLLHFPSDFQQIHFSRSQVTLFSDIIHEWQSQLQITVIRNRKNCKPDCNLPFLIKGVKILTSLCWDGVSVVVNEHFVPSLTLFSSTWRLKRLQPCGNYNMRE